MTDEEFVIGLDLSLTAAGLADLTLKDSPRAKSINLETFGTKGKKGDTFEQRGARLRKMADYIVSWCMAGMVNPSLVVIEGPSYGSQVGSQHDRSGLWWLVTARLQELGIPMAYVAPRARAKYATGNGNAKKDVVLAHVIEQYADLVDGRIANDNEADALTLAAIGARLLGAPIDEGLPESNLSIMDGVEYNFGQS